jgi:8-oxo-dGTP pyrophosphatase MutT (NUDIX family)
VENDPTLPTLGMREFSRRFFKHCPMLARFQGQVEEHVASFSQYKSGVPVYGAIILDPTLTYALLVKGWGKNSTWTFPKGKINKDEAEAVCAAREVFEEIGYDVSPLLREPDHLTASLNDHKIKLYIIPGVPMQTGFATQTVKEISEIKWYAVQDLPAQRVPGGNFFLVTPFVRQLQEWIKCKRTGKVWHPQRHKTPSKAQTQHDEKQRSASVPSQRPEQAAAASEMSANIAASAGAAAGDAEGKSKSSKKKKDKKEGKEGKEGRDSAERKDPPPPRGPNPVFSKAFRFDQSAILAPLEEPWL